MPFALKRRFVSGRLLAISLLVFVVTGFAVFLLTQRGPTPLDERQRQAFRDYFATPGTPGAPVVLWFDSPHYKIADALRLTVRDGVALDGAERVPLDRVEFYVNEQLAQRHLENVVVSAPPAAAFGDVVRVIDACRQSHAHTVILNQHFEGEEQ